MRLSTPHLCGEAGAPSGSGGSRRCSNADRDVNRFCPHPHFRPVFGFSFRFGLVEYGIDRIASYSDPGYVFNKHAAAERSHISMTDDQQGYIEQIEDRIRQWTGRIGDLKSQADPAPAEKKIGMLNQIAELTRRKEELMALLNDLKKAEDDAWERIKTAVEKEAAGLDEAYRASIRFFH